MVLIVCAWIAAVAGGVRAVWSYSSSPGAADPHPAVWPRESRLPVTPGKPTLVMFVHPHCACSRASLAELTKVLEQAPGAATVDVVFLRPSGTAERWEQTDTYARARSLPGVTVIVDDGGVEAARFGAATSGQTLLYDGAGARLFAGGLTGSRGHEGDNAGRQRVLTLLHGRAADRDTSLVYGCSLSYREAGPEGKEER